MRKLLWSLLVVMSLPGLAAAQSQSTQPTEGLHAAKPEWLLIEGATIHTAPDIVLENASILVNGSKIVDVGIKVTAPPGTRVISGKDHHVYAGFIDCFLPTKAIENQPPSTTYWNAQVRPDRDMAAVGSLKELKIDDRRKAGFTACLLAPNQGIIQGKSAVYLLSDEPLKTALLRRDVAMHLSLTARFSFGEPAGNPGGPTSPMGAYALARQTMYDAQWYRDAWRIARNDPGVKRPEQNESLALLQPVIEGSMPVVVSTSNEIFVLRASRFAKEFGLKLIVLGNGNEYRRLKDIADLNVPIILPIDFPEAPKLASPADALNATLEDLMHWDHAPENPGRLANSGAVFGFTTNGLDSPGDFLGRARLAVKRGLSEQAALKALTTNAAKILGVDDQMGTLEKGKIANFILADGPLFADKTKIVTTCVSGTLFEYDEKLPRDFAGLWKVESSQSASTIFLTVATKPKLKIEVFGEEPTEEKGEGVELKSASQIDTQISGSFDAKVIGGEGSALINLAIDVPEQGTGTLVLPGGETSQLTVTRMGDAPKRKMNRSKTDDKENGAGDADEPKSDPEKKVDKGDPAEEKKDAVGDDESDLQQEKDQESLEESKEDKDKKKKEPTEPALHAVNYPFGDFGRESFPDAQSILFRNVTIWTCGPQGIVTNGSVWIENGLIKQVFAEGEELPEVETVIEGDGMHLTPGIIDCHSHMATDSGVNEVGQAITAEVRIGDFIDCDDITIYRQLAGGVTSSNILHGSANPIGGQNQVIKLRWGANDEQMKFAEAPQGIKFALGENVKQSNRREASTRYPQTRMGVEQLLHDTFRAAKEYEASHKSWKTNRTGLPPRVDLELEAIAEILNGQRWIHCHSYRQDEILALIRVLDEYHITIGSFQHILEGYKVADAIAKHGGTASAFSDWWAYKFEVYDAIPYAGAMMHDAGIVVSFNSDDGELARHLNHEAAKAVRFGGVSEDEALKFVTLNPAKQLRIDKYVGSIEVGKQADVVLWNGSPLALTSRCEQTWIDGRKYFDRADAEQLATEQSQRKTALIQRILKLGGGTDEPKRERIDESLLWPRFDEYCHGHDHDHDHE